MSVGNSGWGEIAQDLLCNLDGYGFEDKSWFGAWFIIAAYGYQLQNSIVARSTSLGERLFRTRHYSSLAADAAERDFTAVTVADDLTSHPEHTANSAAPITAEVRD